MFIIGYKQALEEVEEKNNQLGNDGPSSVFASAYVKVLGYELPVNYHPWAIYLTLTGCLLIIIGSSVVFWIPE
jgi:hypothetical protein